MRRDNVFWGGALILFGFLFLLQAQGVINNVFNFFWPLILMLVGGWIIASVYWQPSPGSGDSFSVNLREAKSVRYKFSHGAAQVKIRGGAPAGKAIVGSSAVAMSHSDRLDGDRLEVKVDTGPSLIPIIGPAGGAWQYQITQEVPVALTIEAGASTFDIDLKDVTASRVELKVGASSVDIILPARGASLLDIEGGAASFNLRVPEGAAARIRALEGVGSLNVDTNRFPQLDSGVYQSPDFDSAPNRAEITARAGLGSITVK